MKKFRVKLIDGTFKEIEAENIHNAQSKARIEFGMLPNDINKTIIKTLIKDTNQFINEISKCSKENDWDTLYKTLKQFGNITAEKAGSLVKISEETK